MSFNLNKLLFFVAFFVAATAAMFIASHASGRALTGMEVAAIALLAGAVAARASLLARRREKQKLEEMRDSALW